MSHKLSQKTVPQTVSEFVEVVETIEEAYNLMAIGRSVICLPPMTAFPRRLSRL
jgi:hypothetical protein